MAIGKESKLSQASQTVLFKSLNIIINREIASRDENLSSRNAQRNAKITTTEESREEIEHKILW
jgi:hypothetical protein